MDTHQIDYCLMFRMAHRKKKQHIPFSFENYQSTCRCHFYLMENLYEHLYKLFYFRALSHHLHHLIHLQRLNLTFLLTKNKNKHLLIYFLNLFAKFFKGKRKKELIIIW